MDYHSDCAREYKYEGDDAEESDSIQAVEEDCTAISKPSTVI